MLHICQAHGLAVNYFFRQSDPAHRRAAYDTLAIRAKLLAYIYCQSRKLQTFHHPFVHRLSGDDGIRTRGLRLAKALLSH